MEQVSGMEDSMAEKRLKSGELEWRELDGELLILEAKQMLYLAGNPAATLLWRRLAQGATAEQLCEALMDAYGIEAAVASRDVEAFLAQARELQVLEER